MKSLDGQVAIVTGAGTGIGRATALMLAAEGALVVVAGRRRAPLDEVVRDIEKAGGRATAYQVDLVDTTEAAALGRWTIQAHGRVDVLVNNAGQSSHVRNIRWMPKDQWDAVLGVNLNGVFALTQAVLGAMLAQGGGTIVTVASLAALHSGLLSGAAYGAAKAGARNLMTHVNAVYRNQGIRATTIIPAEVDTPILDKRPFVPDAAARATMMQPEDVARAIVLCATLPPRTVIEEIVMSPTVMRDLSKDIAFNRDLGAPEGRW